MPIYKSVDKDHDTILAQHNIGSSRQPLHILAVSISAGKQVTTHNPLRFRVLATYLSHNSGTFLIAPNIHVQIVYGCKNRDKKTEGILSKGKIIRKLTFYFKTIRIADNSLKLKLNTLTLYL